jgi:hypothetical protein
MKRNARFWVAPKTSDPEDVNATIFLARSIGNHVSPLFFVSIKTSSSLVVDGAMPNPTHEPMNVS